MALQSYRLTIGALIDENNSGKNYVSDQPVYIKTKAGVLAPIFRDINGTSEIFQDGLSNKTDSRGQFVFFVEQGDYIAEYQSQQTPISVFGADYFNSRIDESVAQITADVALSRGYNRKGTFASGFTYELANDVGIDASGDAWVYTDIDALPVIVTAGTVPSEPEYTPVVLSDAESVSDNKGTNVQAYIDSNLTPFKTVAEMKAASFLLSLPEFTRIEWQGYYAQSDGGSNWGVLRFGAHAEDGGSVFSIDTNTYIEANLKGGRINALKFGVKKIESIVDNNSERVQTLINYATNIIEHTLNSVKVGESNVSSLAGGNLAIYFPKGAYSFKDKLYINSVNGLRVLGDGQQATVLVFESENNDLFEVSNYLNLSFENITIMSAEVKSISNGKPDLVVADSGLRNNTCYKFKTANGGTKLYETNVSYIGWGTVYDSLTSSVNGDNHIHTKCTYRFNDLLWDNLNDQAVIWEFNQCQIHFNEVCFRNPATQFFINGGDMINGGDFIVATGLPNLGGGSVLTNVKFENFQNIDPSKKPRFLVLSSGSYDTVKFVNCSDRAGGGTLAGSESFSLAGIFKVNFENSYFSGDINTDNSQSSNRVMSEIRFKNMKRAPAVNQTLSGGTGSKPINVIFEKSVRNEGLPNSYIDRVFAGELVNSTPLSSSISTDVVSMQKTINNSSAGHEFNAFCIEPYLLNVVGAKFNYTNNTTNSFDVILWQDATKTTKIFEKTLTGANSTRKSATLEDSELFAFPAYNISGSAADLYLEVTSTLNAGTITMNCHLELASFV